jgi:GT2 family glycosyltransferase
VTATGGNGRPRVSVVSIALDEAEFAPLREALARQSYRDYEFVGVTGGSIPEAWNEGIRRARGDILVFTETDATPVDERWLGQLVESVPDERTVVKGLEITGVPWDLANLAAHRSVFEGERFDEAFRWAEDTELFCRLKDRGVRLLQVDTAPVIHPQKLRSKRTLRRGFRYGLYWARLQHRYADPIELGSADQALRTIAGAALNLLGLAVGYVVYWPERRRRGGG